MDRLGATGHDRTEASERVLAAIRRSRSVHVTAEDGATGTRLLVDVAELAAAADGVTVLPLRAAGREVPMSAFDGLVSVDAATGVVGHVVAAIQAIRAAGDPPVAVLVDDAAQLDEVSAAVLAHVTSSPHVCLVLATRRDDRLPPALRPVPDESVELRQTRAARRARDAAERRLASLEPDERHAVELLAAARRPIGATIVAELAGTGAADLLEHDDVIIGDRADRRIDLRLVHRIHADVVAAAMGEHDVGVRRRAVADAIEALGARRHDDQLRIALLRDDAAGLNDAARRFLTAHRDATVRADVPEPIAAAFADVAERLARRSLVLGGGLAALEVLTRTLDRRDRADEVRDLLADADRLVVDADDEARLVGMRARLAAKDGRDVRATAALRGELADATPERRTAILRDRIDVLMLGGRVGEAAADGDELSVAGPLAPRVAAPYALALAQCGRARDALDVANPILAARDGVDHDAVGLAALARIAALTELGRLASAAEMATLVVAVADGTDEVGFQATSRLMSSMVELSAGRAAAAAELADAAAQRFERAGWLGLPGGALGVAAAAHAQSGNLAAARARLRAAEAIAAEPRALHQAVAHGRAWWLLSEGHHDRAVRELVDIATRLQADGGAASETLVLHDLVRVGEPALALPRLEQLAAVVQGPLARLAADHALALLANDGAALDAVGRRAAGHGMLLVAADAAAQAAAAHVQRGAVDAAAASRSCAEALVARCDGAFTPQTAPRRRSR